MGAERISFVASNPADLGCVAVRSIRSPIVRQTQRAVMLEIFPQDGEANECYDCVLRYFARLLIFLDKIVWLGNLDSNQD